MNSIPVSLFGRVFASKARLAFISIRLLFDKLIQLLLSVGMNCWRHYLSLMGFSGKLFALPQLSKTIHF